MKRRSSAKAGRASAQEEKEARQRDAPNGSDRRLDSGGRGCSAAVLCLQVRKVQQHCNTADPNAGCLKQESDASCRGRRGAKGKRLSAGARACALDTRRQHGRGAARPRTWAPPQTTGRRIHAGKSGTDRRSERQDGQSELPPDTDDRRYGVGGRHGRGRQSSGELRTIWPHVIVALHSLEGQGTTETTPSGRETSPAALIGAGFLGGGEGER